MKDDPIDQARALILVAPKTQIDYILATLQVSHEEYRQRYPNTPITPSLALDIMDAKEFDGMANENIRRKWNLTQSQLNYALYNDAAIITANMSLPRLRVEQALKTTNKSQTTIAEEENVSQSYVHVIAKQLDLLPKRKKRVTLTKEQWAVIIQKIQEGESVEQLAKQNNISRDTIYKKMRSL